MATAKARKPRKHLIRANIREAVPIGGQRVDRAEGIIYHVKIVGRESPNTHGVHGVNGTLYTLECLQNALPLYEGIKVNVDHPPRSNPDAERSAKDRFAWITEAEVTEEGIFGNLHFLDREDPLAIRMMHAAELKPDAFALSHNAEGKGIVKDGKYIVTEIPEVRSVDIVADGGTNRSLFEGRKMSTTWTLRRRIKESKQLTPRMRKRLLEMGAHCAEEDMDKEMGEERPAMEDDMAGEEKGEGQTWRNHLINSIGELVQSEDGADHDRAAKLMKHLRPDEKETAEMEEAGDIPPGDGEEKEEGEAGKEDRGDPEKPLGAINTAGDQKGKESMESRQRRVKSLCKLAGIDASTNLVESLARMSTSGAIAAVEAIKGASGNGRSGGARSMAAGSIPVRESRMSGDHLKNYADTLLLD